MQIVDLVVGVRVRVASFRQLAEQVASLSKPFRPTYFTVGERVRNKDASRIDDTVRFSAFISDHVARVSGFDLIGEGIRFGFFVGETRNAQNESTHVGCSIILRGRKWTAADQATLLNELCLAPGVERAYACQRTEWNYRHLCTKELPKFSVQESLGVDMSAFLPGLYWWTVFSDELAARHQLDVDQLAGFAGHYERWPVGEGNGLHSFRLYDAPDDWQNEKERVSEFLEDHPNFFSLTRIAARIQAAETKAELDHVVRSYWAGAVPWESAPKHLGPV